MARTPKDEKRRADSRAAAILVAKIATGEIEDKATDNRKNAAAVALGRLGGKARAEKMSKKQRSAIARMGAKARWG